MPAEVGFGSGRNPKPHGEHDPLGDNTIKILDSGPSRLAVGTSGLSVGSSRLEGLSLI